VNFTLGAHKYKPFISNLLRYGKEEEEEKEKKYMNVGG